MPFSEVQQPGGEVTANRSGGLSMARAHGEGDHGRNSIAREFGLSVSRVSRTAAPCRTDCGKRQDLTLVTRANDRDFGDLAADYDSLPKARTSPTPMTSRCRRWCAWVTRCAISGHALPATGAVD